MCCWLLLCRLVQEGVLKPQADIEVPEIPMDLATAVKLKKVGCIARAAGTVHRVRCVFVTAVMHLCGHLQQL